MSGSNARFDEFDPLVVEMHDASGVVEYTFALTGGPIDELGEGQDVLTAYGHAAAAWARLEKHLEILLVHINKAHHSSEALDLFDPNHPRSVFDKLKRLKRYFNQHPALSGHTLAFRELATEIAKASTDRNNFLHSILESYEPVERIIRFKTIEPKEPRGSDNFRVQEQMVPYENLIHFAVTVVKLNRRLAAITTNVFTTDVLERLQRP